MSTSSFTAITPAFSFRPTSPFIAALAAAAQRRLESVSPSAEAAAVRPPKLGEAGAELVVNAAPLDTRVAPSAAGQASAAFADARAALGATA